MQSIRLTAGGLSFLVVNTPCTVVPLAQFREEEQDDTYQTVFSHADLQSHRVCRMEVKQLGVVVLFSVPRDEYEAFKAEYPKGEVVNTFAQVMASAADFFRHDAPEGQSLLAYVNKEKIYLYSIIEGELKFANSFDLESEENAIYYLLSVWKVLQLEMHQDNCFIAGEDEAAQNLANEAAQYLFRVTLADLEL